MQNTISAIKPGSAARLARTMRRYAFRYMLCLPGIALVLIFCYSPLYFLQVAFKDYSVFTGMGSEWVGINNFRILFQSKYFLRSLKNTLILFGMYKLIGSPLPVILALLLNELTNKVFKRTVQTVLYFPHFLSWVIVGGIWTTILSPSNGIVNRAIEALGSDTVFFMADKRWFRWVLLFTNSWKGCGWGTIVFLAAISGIDQEIYEAAEVDGVTRLKRIWYITLPCILPTFAVMFILGLSSVLGLFDQVFIMQNSMVSEVSETIAVYTYNISLVSGKFSLGTASGLFNSIISAFIVFASNHYAGKLRGQALL